MSKEFKVAYFDIDKTLMTGDDRPSDKILNALSLVPRKGVNTTRSINQTERVIKPDEVNLPSIVLSGSEIWRPGGEMIVAFPIDADTLVLIAKYLKENAANIKLARFYPTGSRKLHLYVSTDELEQKFRDIYAVTGALGNLYRDIGPFADLLTKTETSDVIIRFNGDQVNELSRELKVKVEAETSVRGELTITAKGINKANAFLWVCNFLNINPASVLTAGDSAPDDEVFKHSYGIAVSENSLPHAKEQLTTIDELAERLTEIFS